MRTSENQVEALQRALVLLGQDPKDQHYLAAIRQLLADATRQVDSARNEYDAVLEKLKNIDVEKDPAP